MRTTGTAHTVQITRTIEIEVETTIYLDYGEIEIGTAIDCETGEPIKLTESEVDQINESTLSEFKEGLADAEADAKEDQRKLDEWDERRGGAS